MGNIKTLLLDADGVVQLSSPNWLDSVAQLCADPDQAEEFVQDVFAAEAPSLIGQSNFSSDLEAVLQRWHSSASIADALAVWTLITPNQDVLTLIRELRQSGTVVALASNQQAYRAEYMSHQLGYADQFDQLFYSYELGCKKPRQEYFAAILQKLNCEPHEVLFIDDHQANVDAAQQVPIHAERYHLDMGVPHLKQILKQYGI